MSKKRSDLVVRPTSHGMSRVAPLRMRTDCETHRLGLVDVPEGFEADAERFSRLVQLPGLDLLPARFDQFPPDAEKTPLKVRPAHILILSQSEQSTFRLRTKQSKARSDSGPIRAKHVLTQDQSEPSST